MLKPERTALLPGAAADAGPEIKDETNGSVRTFLK
jgi:hypothetical protein